MGLVNLQHNCRICLKPRKAFKDVYCHVVEGFEDPLVKLVFSLFEIQLQTHKSYPQFMCKRCLNKLTHILLYKQELLRNQQILFGLFKASHNYEKKIDLRESIQSNRSRVVSNWNNRGEFDLKLDGLDDRIAIITEPLTGGKLKPSQKAQDSSTYLGMFQSQLSVKQHSQITYKSKQLQYEHFTRRATRSTCNPECQISQSSKITCRENIHKLPTEYKQPNNCKSTIYVKNESDFGDPPNNNVILQSSFLQNVNLITVQHAQMLKDFQGQSPKTRRKGVPFKHSLYRMNKSTPKTTGSKNGVEEPYITLPAREIKTSKSLIDLQINTDTERKLGKNSSQSKVISEDEDKGKCILKTCDLFVNKHLLMNSNNSLNATCEDTDAIPKHIGCETDCDISCLDNGTLKPNILNSKQAKRNIKNNNSLNSGVEKESAKIVEEKNKKSSSHRPTKQIRSRFVRCENQSTFNTKCFAKRLNYTRLTLRSQSKSELRNLRSSRSINDLSKEYGPDRKRSSRNLLNTCTNRRTSNTLVTPSLYRSFNISPVSKNKCSKRK